MHYPDEAVIDSYSQKAILDTDPTIVMDIALGSLLSPTETINVDYQKLRGTIDSITKEKDHDGSSLTINLVRKSSRKYDVGGYLPDENAVELVFDNEKPAQVQKSLQHELQHYADNDRLPTSQSVMSKMYSVGNITSGPGTIAASAATAILVGNKLLWPIIINSPDYIVEVSDMIDMHTPSIGMGLLGVFALSGLYHFDKYELRARLTECKRYGNTFSIDRM